MAELIRQNPCLRWDVVLQEAARHRCRRLLLVGLWLACTVLEAPVPDLIRDEWEKDAVVPALGTRVEAELGEADSSESNSWSFQWSIRECWRDRIESTLRLAATPTQADRDFVHLPACLQLFYVPVRAVRLALKYTWRRMRR